MKIDHYLDFFLFIFFFILNLHELALGYFLTKQLLVFSLCSMSSVSGVAFDALF